MKRPVLDKRTFFTLRVGPALLWARAAPPLANQARDLLAQIARVGRELGALGDGTVVPFGFCDITLLARGEKLVLHEPDFAFPTELRPDVTMALAVTRAQMRLARSVGVLPVPTSHTDGVHVAEGALGVPRVLLRRGPPHARATSGWCLLPASTHVPKADPSTTSSLHSADADADAGGSAARTTITAGRLFVERPRLSEALALPMGYEVAFDGDVMVSILGPTVVRVGEAGAGAA